ncbi:DUF397 domain-containing protein [Streptomyces sp. NPDC059618]|uniref:DUF397 domain-containing protein n=1 Tax=Streptomyces sp. NPDC059618 TaxID=3346887 RepID=UPI0036BD591B
METNTREDDLTPATWRKASYSGGEGGNCLEIAPGAGREGHLVRDSKNPGPVIAFGAEAWGTFVGHL